MRGESGVRPVDAGKIALVAGLLTAAVHLAYHVLMHDSYPGDYVWALRTAYTLLHGIDPYGFTPDPQFIPYPLPVALFGFPLLPLTDFFPMVVAGAIFIGVSAATLTWSMLRADEGWRLAAILLSGAYWVAVIVSQWSPLIVSAWYLPLLAPLLVLIKPQIALPVAAARRPSMIGLLIAAVVLLLSLLVDPSWPLRYLRVVGPYQATIPLVTLPFGPLLLLAAFHWRDERARLLLIMAIMPQRAVYDFLPLWLVPRTRRQMLVLTLLSWLVVLPGLPTWPAMVSTPDLRWAVNVVYVAALAFVLWPAHTATAGTPLAGIASRLGLRGLTGRGEQIEPGPTAAVPAGADSPPENSVGERDARETPPTARR